MVPREIMLQLKWKDICGQLIFSSVTNLISVFPTWELQQLDTHMLWYEINLLPQTNTKINSKCIKVCKN